MGTGFILPNILQFCFCGNGLLVFCLSYWTVSLLKAGPHLIYCYIPRIDLQPFKRVASRLLLCVSGTVPGISQGAWRFLIFFVTEQNFHYFTWCLNLPPKWQESNVAFHRREQSAPGVVWTLSTQNSSPFPNSLMGLPDNSAHSGIHLTQVVYLQ